MNAPPIDQSVISSIVDVLRREAEAQVASLQAQLVDAARRSAIARIVAGYYNLIMSMGQRLMTVNMALGFAIAKTPTPALKAQYIRSVQLLQLWSAQAQGFAVYCRQATAAEAAKKDNVGNPLVAGAVVVAVLGTVAVVAVSITGVAWAVVHYEDAVNLSKELDTLQAHPETAAALVALRQAHEEAKGNGPGEETPSATWIGLGALAALGVGGFIYMASRRK